ncbi:MAG TPA: hypothetical protein VGE07_30205 [Herpetosiphonaceae bacterium]
MGLIIAIVALTLSILGSALLFRFKPAAIRPLGRWLCPPGAPLQVVLQKQGGPGEPYALHIYYDDARGNSRSVKGKALLLVWGAGFVLMLPVAAALVALVAAQLGAAG